MYAIVRSFNNVHVVIRHERADTPENAREIARRNDKIIQGLGTKGEIIGYIEVDEQGENVHDYEFVTFFDGKLACEFGG